MKSLVLLSGGVDSAVCLARLRGQERIAVGFDYGQGHLVELEYAAKFADSEGVPFRVVRLPSIPKTNSVVFAARNAILLAHAVSIAMVEGCGVVVIGTNKTDHEHFPDCRPGFLYTVAGAMSTYGVQVSYPLSDMEKDEVVAEALSLGLSMSGLWTCYAPTEMGPCGACMACLARGPL